jgi:DNA-binding NarL/FixJ family response regulator
MRILVADDQAKVRSAIRLLLEHDEDIKVLGEAVDATGLLDWVSVACPDLVLLDWELPGRDMGELLDAVRGNCSSVKVVALSGRPEARREAIAAGADGFASKGDPPERLLDTLRSCAGQGRIQPSEDTALPEASGDETHAVFGSVDDAERDQELSA